MKICYDHLIIIALGEELDGSLLVLMKFDNAVNYGNVPPLDLEHNDLACLDGLVLDIYLRVDSLF